MPLGKSPHETLGSKGSVAWLRKRPRAVQNVFGSDPLREERESSDLPFHPAPGGCLGLGELLSSKGTSVIIFSTAWGFAIESTLPSSRAVILPMFQEKAVTQRHQPAQWLLVCGGNGGCGQRGQDWDGGEGRGCSEGLSSPPWWLPGSYHTPGPWVTDHASGGKMAALALQL